MTTKQAQYWLKRRSTTRLVRSEIIGKDGLKTIIGIYDEALKKVNREITKIYTKYSTEAGLSVDELSLILNRSDKTAFLASIHRTMERLGFDVKDVYKPKYLAQLTRLDSMKEQIYWQIAELSTLEKGVSKKTYAEIIQSAYENMQKDFNHVGVISTFSQIDTAVVREILKSKWVGGNYSTRIWGNVSGFAQQIRDIIGSSLLVGESYEKTSRLIAERFGVAKYRARTLVLTETNYFHNQAEATAYEDDGIERYQFDAVMDGRTSDICEEHNGKIYDLKEKEVGTNWPPLHPNCRSTTFPLIEGEVEYKRKRPIKQ